MSRNRTKLLVVVAAITGFALSQLVGPIFQRAKKYFDLSGYSRPTEAQFPKVPEGGVANFALLDLNGDGYELYRQFDASAIVIVSTIDDCPIIQKSAAKIMALKKEYETRNIRFFMIDSNPGDRKEDVAAQFRHFPLHVPVLLDPSQVAAKALGFKRSAEVVVLDPKSWKVVYRGPIDDRLAYGAELPQARNNYLQDALEAYLHDRPIPQAPRSVLGCAITFKKEDHPITYSDDVAAIVGKKCTRCHNPSFGLKPYFTDFESVKSWGAMIKDTILTHRMPPWSWDLSVPQKYLYSDVRSITPDEARIVTDWVDAGSPRGQGSGDPLVRQTKYYSVLKQRLAKPDVAYKNIPIVVPPKGFNEYQFYQVGGPMPRDMWIMGTNVESTNFPAIHHQMLIVTPHPLSYYRERVKDRRDEELSSEDETGAVPAWDLHEMKADNYGNDDFIRIQISALGMTQPSMFGKAWGDSLGFFIPKGSYLILETHYHGTGKPEREQTTLGLYEYKGSAPLTNIRSGKVSFVNNIELPAGGKNILAVGDPIVLTKKSGLLGMGVHMHMRGLSARYYATYPDGREELLASIPFFDYNTSTARGIAFPADKIFPAGTSLRIECRYDNSATNPFNPDPTKPIHWGQTLDRSEMCMGYFWYYDLPDSKGKHTKANVSLK